MDVTLVFPHQLFRNHPAVARSRKVILVEDDLYFAQYPFHRQKLVLHRASMKFYESFLKECDHEVDYIDSKDASLRLLFHRLKKQKVTIIHYSDTVDYLLERRLKRWARESGVLLAQHSSHGFINSAQENTKVVTGDKKALMANFYVKQRKRLNILVDDTVPVGGKWSFDTENRQKIPKGMNVPVIAFPTENRVVIEAKEYVTKNFNNSLGAVDKFLYAVTFQDAEKILDDFLIHRMKDFGAYEDAILKNELTLFHSMLTPALNIGLLTPQQIVSRTLELHETKKFPLNSLEGFIRQIIGWREFMRLMYEQKGTFLRTNNHFKYRRKIPRSFYLGTTGIEPVDHTIKKVLTTGYCHHIERLMILSNFMLLCQFDPDDVYRWFMELFVDAYDWVMVPNVYGMGQYADGGWMTTKSYVSGSSYVLKMSDYKKSDWCAIWDSLYWKFIFDNRKEFATNPRMSMMVSLVDKMEQTKRDDHLQRASRFLNSLAD